MTLASATVAVIVWSIAKFLVLHMASSIVVYSLVPLILSLVCYSVCEAICRQMGVRMEEIVGTNIVEPAV